MAFFLVIVAVFVGASIYFFFKAESLQKALLTAKRENTQAQKNYKILQEAVALTARKNEDSLKHRIEKVKEKTENHDDINLIMPLINNYAVIYSECLKGKGRLKGICKKCFDTYDTKAFNQFITFLKSKDKSLQRFWGSDNLNGYVSLVEALLVLIEYPPSKK